MSKWQVINGNNIDILREYPDNTFDSIVTDPPYGIEFLGKDWDKNTGAMETWEECYRVLKPGGYILAFSAARTYHHLATNVEMAGFEIRDQIMWLYGSGFPKAQDIGKALDKRNGKTHKKPDLIPYDNKGADSESLGAYRGKCPKCLKDQTHQLKCNDQECVLKDTPADNEWSGWKTALKPAHEPIVMGRKPFKGSCVDNVLTHGTGAMNIDASRVGDEEITTSYNPGIKGKMAHGYTPEDNKTHRLEPHIGRYPSNVLGEVEGYQKFFYCPKVSRKERHIGFEKLPEPEKFNNPDEMKKHPLWDPSIGTNSHRLMQKIREHQGIPPNKDYMVEAMGGTWIGDNMIELPHKGKIYVHGLKHEYELWCKANNITPPNVGNNHPTVKPVELMKYLIKLVTPPGGRVLDPFNGSGSTGMAAVELGYEYVGCELDPDYVEIANNRIRAWEKMHDTPANKLFD